MPVASILTELTEALTTVVGDYGLYAVFVLMFVDAILPAASEPVMVFGGALASGAFAGRGDVCSAPTSRTASGRGSRSGSPGRSGTCSARSSAGGSASTAAIRSSSDTGAGCT